MRSLIVGYSHIGVFIDCDRTAEEVSVVVDIDPEIEQRITFLASVVRMGPRWIELDHTEFELATPERVSDTGFIGGLRVASVESDGEQVHHIVEASDAATQLLTNLAPGLTLTCEIDGVRRSSLRRLHSLLCLCYLAFRLHHGEANRSGCLIGPDLGTFELSGHDLGSVPVVDVDGMRAWITQVVADDLVITSLSRPLDRVNRYWHIDGVGTLPCGGSHPETTGEIGRFTLCVDGTSSGDVRISCRLDD